MDAEQPLVKRDVAIFKDALDRDGELLAASGARPQTLARFADALSCGLYGFDFFRRLFLDVDTVGFTHEAAMRADNAVRPTHIFKVLTRLIFVGEVRFKDGA